MNRTSFEERGLQVGNLSLRPLYIQSFLFLSTARFSANPVGMKNGKIKNRAVTASSFLNNYHAPWLARLRRIRRGRYVGAWVSRYNNHNQWLQVDLGRTMKVTGIETQGRQDSSQWVTAYYVLYSSDGVYFAQVKHWWNAVKVGFVINCNHYSDSTWRFTLLEGQLRACHANVLSREKHLVAKINL